MAFGPRGLVITSMLALVVTACGAAADDTSATRTDDATSTPTETYAAPIPSSDPPAAPTPTPAPAPTTPAAPAEVTPDQLLALVATCAVKKSSAPFAADSGGTANIDVCGLSGAVFWKADLDVDCDGKSSTVCNKSTDAAYQSQTAATDSKGAALDAATLPYVVVPLVSSRFDYKAAGLALGTVVAVLYKGKMEFGIIGDLGPSSIIGEASYAMADKLGIDPDPSTGGVSSGVTYIAFTGAAAKVTKNEDHAEAVTLGQALAKKLVADN